MITLNEFERLIVINIDQQLEQRLVIGDEGEFLQEWILTLSGMNKHEKYQRLRDLLNNLLVADIGENVLFRIMSGLTSCVDQTVSMLHHDYVYEHRVLSSEQQKSVFEVRDLYFLMILIYKNIATRAYIHLHQDGDDSFYNQTGWLKKVVSMGSDAKKLITASIYHMMGLYLKIILEFALNYEHTPRIVWQQLNFWYLRAVQEDIAYHKMTKNANASAKNSINGRYEQACIASFINFFAYRRQDMLMMFKILPDWVNLIQSTFEARPELRLFVNLSGNYPPEFITPYATVNPYSEEYQCLFFDASALVSQLKKIQSGKYISNYAQAIFERRLATLALLSFDRYAKQDKIDRIGQQPNLLLTGFGAIFHEISGGKTLAEVIDLSNIQDTQPKQIRRLLHQDFPKEQVIVSSKSDILARFYYANPPFGKAIDGSSNIQRNFLQVFGIFALKSENSTHKNPWRLGVVQWVDKYLDNVEVDGRLLGRILLTAGVRLLSHDDRGQDYVHALLIEGDEPGHQSTLIIPRCHFKVGDLLLMRTGVKEIELRLERNLLSTDEVEQYQIVRLNG